MRDQQNLHVTFAKAQSTMMLSNAATIPDAANAFNTHESTKLHHLIGLNSTPSSSKKGCSSGTS
jgi:hypothetical protein